MSNPPSTPILRLNPIASNNALKFYWLAPESGPAVSCYSLICSSIQFSTIINAQSTYCQISDLIDSQDYTFQLAAKNAAGISPYVPFYTAQPGITPAGPSNLTVSTINQSTINVVWSFTTNTDEGKNNFFIISLIQSTNISNLSTYYIPTYPNQRSQIVSNLPVPSKYTCLVQSLSDAGWSPPSISTTFTLINPTQPGSILFSQETYLTTSIPSLNFSMGTNDFTLECWAKATDVINGSWNPIVSIGNSTTQNGHEIRLAASNANGRFGFIIPNTSGGDIITDTGISMTTNAWYHLVVERFGLNVKMYINGTEATAATQTLNSNSDLNHVGNSPNGKGPFWINNDGWGEANFTGYVTNVRLVKGSAVYKNNFSVPTSPLSAIANTVLLLNMTNDANYLVDSSPQNFTMVTQGSLVASSITPFA